MDKRIEIVYEDDALIVCHKYPGIAVQTASFGQADMVSELKKYLVQQGGSPYLAVVHRLDQPVEGLLVFAKTETAAASLSKLYRRRMVSPKNTQPSYTGKCQSPQGSLRIIW